MPTQKHRIVKKLDLSKLNPKNIEYFCISDDIDRAVMKRKGKTYNEDLAFNSLYFILTKDKRISVKEKDGFDKYIQIHSFEQPEKSKDAQDGIDWFISEIHRIKNN